MLKKKIIAICLAICSVFGLASCGSSNSSESSSNSSSTPEVEVPEHLGLYAAEDGTLMKDGKEFYGFGVDYYSLLNRAFTEKWDVSKSLASLEVLASYDVRVIRFNLGGYAGTDWNYVIKKEERYFAALDAIVDKAAEVGIGLLPCFFWGSIADYYSEPQGTSFADENTKSMQFVKSFTEKVVTRYAYHPGIYGWEFSNETNLSSDIGDAYFDYMSTHRPDGTPRNEDDLIKSEYYTYALNIWSSVVKRCDPYNRIIGNGDAEFRESAWNLKAGNGWKVDTQEQHEEMLDYLNQDMTAVSLHKYPNYGISSAKDFTKVHSYLGYYDTWDGFMEYFVAQGKRMKKAIYLGETGWIYPDANAVNRATVEQVAEITNVIIDAAIKADMPLALFWNYDDRPNYNPADPTDKAFPAGTEWSWNERWEKGIAILEAIKEGNRRYDEKHAAQA